MTGVNYCDTIEEQDELCELLEWNPDFTLVGHFDTIQDIYDYLNYQGFSDEQIAELSTALYGNCLEIVEYSSHYTVYIGAR